MKSKTANINIQINNLIKFMEQSEPCLFHNLNENLMPVIKKNRYYTKGAIMDMDSRTPKQLEEELINYIIELQDFVGVMFPWRIAQNPNEVILNTQTIKDIILFIKKLV